MLGFDPDQTFEVRPAVIEHTRKAVERGQAARAEWQTSYDAWARKPSADVDLYERLQTRTLPTGWADGLPTFPADEKGMATRKASGEVINAIAERVPELWGGSADLAESNNTTIEDAPSFIPKDRSARLWKGDPLAGRVLHFGIREHAMGAIMNGIAVHGGTRVFGGTFLTFSDYMRGAVRLAALMGAPVTYVWTHDSIGLGEDGPTHQPIEHLAALRAIPGLDVVRPADANETAACWRTVLEHTDRPAGIVLTRQNVPTFPRGEEGFNDTGNVHRGGYVLIDAPTIDGRDGPPDVVLVGTGSEVQLAVEARRLLDGEGGPRPRRLDAVPRVVRRPGGLLPGDRDPADRQGPGLRRGRRRPGLARGRRRPRPDRLHRALRRLRRLRPHLPRVRRHGARPSPTPPRTASASPPAEQVAARHPRPSRPRRKNMTDRLQQLSDAGVSIWLDDLSRERIETGNLAELAKDKHVVGVTTNPTIFANALADGERYDDQIRALAADGADVSRATFELTTEDVRNACDVLMPLYSADPIDGRVSIEVDPGLAHDTDATIDSAQELWDTVDRPNAFIKIPASDAGLPAIRTATGRGISVNVTLIFGIDRYREVMESYLAGLEDARDAGHDLSTIHSVASFFVSRVDTEVDKRLDAIGTDDAEALKGQAAIANARLAYAAFEEVFGTDRFAGLEAAGARRQRPLWASTGVKDPAYPDTMYVTDLVVAGCVNTMPQKTMEAFEDHGELEGDTVSGRAAEAQRVMDNLKDVGIDFDDVLAVLEREGVEKFEKSWAELVETITGQLEKAAQ